MPRKRILEFFNLRGPDCQFIASFGIPFRPRSGLVQGGNGGAGEYDPYVPRMIAQAREELPAGLRLLDDGVSEGCPSRLPVGRRNKFSLLLPPGFVLSSLYKTY